jgi:tRNA (adenine57-N1/adenine58-N1)-methyltransferase catalytic subunit
MQYRPPVIHLPLPKYGLCHTYLPVPSRLTIILVMKAAQPGDMILLLGPDGKRLLHKLTPGQQVHTHLGFFTHDAILGLPYGSLVPTQLGFAFVLLQPSTLDLVMHVKRTSQIVYPKEIGYLLLKMNVIPGTRIVEAGTGSGGLTLALARAVQPTGKVYSYEERAEFQTNARKNVERVGLGDCVEFKVRDIREGFDEREVDALFLDVREPWLFLAQAHAALTGGGFFGSLVPTTNQVSEILAEMERLGGWVEVEVSEILHRFYKANAERLRPADRMVAHTGYLVFARAVSERVEQFRTARERRHLSKRAALEPGEPEAATLDESAESDTTESTKETGEDK